MRAARLFPFLETIRNYSAQDFKADMTAARFRKTESRLKKENSEELNHTE